MPVGHNGPCLCRVHDLPQAAAAYDPQAVSMVGRLASGVATADDVWWGAADGPGGEGAGGPPLWRKVLIFS